MEFLDGIFEGLSKGLSGLFGNTGTSSLLGGQGMLSSFGRENGSPGIDITNSNNMNIPTRDAPIMQSQGSDSSILGSHPAKLSGPLPKYGSFVNGVYHRPSMKYPGKELTLADVPKVGGTSPQMGTTTSNVSRVFKPNYAPVTSDQGGMNNESMRQEDLLSGEVQQQPGRNPAQDIMPPYLQQQNPGMSTQPPLANVSNQMGQKPPTIYGEGMNDTGTMYNPQEPVTSTSGGMNNVPMEQQSGQAPVTSDQGGMNNNTAPAEALQQPQQSESRSLNRFQQSFPKAAPGMQEAFAANKPFLEKYGITEGPRMNHFMAQMAHESGGFKHLKELSSGKAYEGRRSLGNTEPGDGARFKGRGIIQLTGRANYKTYGDKLGIDLVGHPELAADPDVAVKVAALYWNDKNLNSLADKGDLRGITKRINGGMNGYQDRKMWLSKLGNVDEHL